MFINQVTVKNFKSFREEHIILNDLNIIIGSNAAGKSNFISILRFIDQIIECGIDNAIAMAGGLEYVLNTSIGRNHPLHLSFSINCSKEDAVLTLTKHDDCELYLDSFDYSFELMPHKKGGGFRIARDILKMNYYQMVKEDERNHYSVEYKRINGKNTISIHNSTTFENEEAQKSLNEGIDKKFFEAFFSRADSRKELILTYIYFFLPPFIRAKDLIRIYDFDPRLMKKPSVLTSITSLEEDGSNIASILQYLLKSKSTRHRLENLLKDSLPFIESISTESRFDKSVSYKVKEKYSSKTFYSHFLSDGTVNVLALIVAMYFDNSRNVLVFEEPERNLHPQLMSRLLEMAYETAQDRQIIITTHTPEMLKHARLESILLAKRCNDGFTHITKPADSEMVQAFLQNEVGIGELFVQNLLEV